MSAARDQLLADIFTTAIEGGINYWSECSSYHWRNPDGTDDLRGFKADINDLYNLLDPDDDDSGQPHHVDRSTLVKGYTLATTTHRDRIRWSCGEQPPLVITDDTDWDYDAGDADVIVQLGLFGEVVYG